MIAIAVVAAGPASPGGGEAEAAGTYRALANPRRILDTRSGLHTFDGRFAGIGIRPKGSTLRLQVAGRAGVPVDAAAVALNVTATRAAGAGFAVLYPCGVKRPLASSVNFTAAGTVANAVLARVGTGGDVCLYTNQRSHFVVDVSGSFPTGTYRGLAAPRRLVDTRPGRRTADHLLEGIGRRPARSTLAIPVAGRAGITAGAETVVMNLTSTESTAGGFALLYPCGTARPNASTVNFVRGETIAAAAIVKVGARGRVCLYSRSPSHFVVDVSGELPSTTYVPLSAPRRLVETRRTGSTHDWQYSNIGLRRAGTSLQLRVAGRAGVPADASAVVLNVTAIQPVRVGFATVFPTGASRPNASTVNSRPGRAIANSVIAKVGAGGDVCLYTRTASHFVVDVAGYLLGRPPAAAGATCPTPLGRPRNALVGQPDVAAHDGRLFVGAVSEQDKLYVRTRSDASQKWSGWTGLGHPPGATDMGGPVSAAVSDGRLFMFVSAGTLSGLFPSFGIAFRSRSAATDRWTRWHWLRGPGDPPFLSSVDAVAHDGRLFVVGAAGLPGPEQIWTRTRRAATDRWSAWTSLGRPPGTAHAGEPTVVASGGKLFVFVVASDLNLWFRMRRAATDHWSGWRRLGRPRSTPDLSVGRPAASVADGRLFVFPDVSSPGAPVSYRTRNASTGRWSGWSSVGTPPDTYSWSSPTAVAADDRLFIVVSVLSDWGWWRTGWFKARSDATNRWGRWGDLGSFPFDADGPLHTVAAAHGGVLYLFGIERRPYSAARLRLKTRSDVSGRWSEYWSSLGHPGPYQ